jgi:hypothetical protein
LTETLSKVLKNWQKLSSFKVIGDRPFYRLVFVGRIVQDPVLSHRTMQGSVISDRTISVHHFWRENIEWFSIIGQNLFGSEFLDRESFLVQHYRAEPSRIQYYRTEPLKFRIFRRIKFHGSVLLDTTSLVQEF